LIKLKILDFFLLSLKILNFTSILSLEIPLRVLNFASILSLKTCNIRFFAANLASDLVYAYNNNTLIRLLI